MIKHGCEIKGCKKWAMKSPHHLITRGAGGSNEKVNLIYLCAEHHVEVHNIGRWSFVERYGIGKRLQDAINFKHRR